MVNLKKILVVFCLAVLSLLFVGCGLRTKVDYGDAYSFESALNRGEDLEGKTVMFLAIDLRPNSAWGYNIWAGEHLNFISSKNPKIKVGDYVSVKVTSVTSHMGSWLIEYKKIKKGVIGKNTIVSNGKEYDTSDLNGAIDSSEYEELEQSASNEKEEKKEETKKEDYVAGSDFVHRDEGPSYGESGPPVPQNKEAETKEVELEIIETGWFLNSSDDEDAFMDYCGIIHNPDDNLVANYPHLNITVKDKDGKILGTETQDGTVIQPGDTVIICGMLSINTTNLSEEPDISFSVDSMIFETDSGIYPAARTDDFELSNINESKSGRNHLITGEITNHFSEDISRINLSMILRNDGKIVYSENLYLDNLKTEQTKAFEFQRYSEWPEHDSIEFSAMPW